MKKFIKKLSVSLTLVLGLTLSVGIPGFSKDISPNNSLVGENDIIQGITSFINMDSNFFGYSVNDLYVSKIQTTYYDSDRKIVSYGRNILDKKNNNTIGYVIIGANYSLPTIIEAGKGSAPEIDKDKLKLSLTKKLNEDIDVDNIELFYGGPFAYFAKVDSHNTNKEKRSDFVNLKTSEFISDVTEKDLIKSPNIPYEEKLKNNKKWETVTNRRDIISQKELPFIKSVYAEQPTPPTYGYTSINFSLNSTDIQDSLGWPMSVYTCGPSAGALLAWHLGDRISYYNQLKNAWKDDMYLQNNIIEVARELSSTMSAIGGTTVSEFITGMTSFASAPLRNYSINLTYKYVGSSLGSTANTTSNLDVWENIKTGINNRNAPVALGIGNSKTSGSTYYPEQYARFSYHWVVVSGYIQDADYNMYVKCKSWGSDYYASFNSMCYWRDALASVYINAYY